MKQIGCALLLLVVGCASVRTTEDIPAVTNFSPEVYMGEWYEIARLPDNLEKNLQNVKFTYSRKDGFICLARSGVCEDRNRTLNAKGQYDNPSVGECRFTHLDDFGLFHRVIWVSPKYDKAIVTSDSRDNLWILAREKKLPKAELDQLVGKAKDWGFDTEKLEYPEQK